MSPTKPAQKRAAPVTADSLPIGQAEMITLPDGKQVRTGDGDAGRLAFASFVFPCTKRVATCVHSCARLRSRAREISRTLSTLVPPAANRAQLVHGILVQFELENTVAAGPGVVARRRRGSSSSSSTSSLRLFSPPSPNQRLPTKTRDKKQIPIRIPPGLPPQIAAMVVQQLRSDPAAAQAAYDQAQRALATPGLAQAYLRMGAAAAAGAGGGGTAGGAVGPGAFALAGEPAAVQDVPGLPPGLAPERALEALRGDPELAGLVEELQAGGPAALEKYWNDAGAMAKISARLRAASLADKAGEGGGGGEGAAAAAAAADDADGDGDGLLIAAKPAPASPPHSSALPARGAGAPPPATPPSGASPAAAALHAAARKGDAPAVRALLAEAGAAAATLIDARGGDRSGAAALGVAVGLGRLEAARALLDAGAGVDRADARGNTPLHYAAGYGRRPCLELLLERGADAAIANASGQRAADVARQNGESAIAALLAAREKRERRERERKGKADGAQAVAGAGGGNTGGGRGRGAGPSLAKAAAAKRA